MCLNKRLGPEIYYSVFQDYFFHDRHISLQACEEYVGRKRIIYRKRGKRKRMNDQEFMRRAIELAKKGGGWTNPNPNVGAVIVKDGQIIGEGYHEKYGELHAERNAFASLKEDATGATLYVTLEPCCHQGKTPPCTDAIIENKIAKVVIGSKDPNPLVAGKGAEILREHGIEVVEDFLKDECDALNDIFFHFITTKKPYVAMKYAMTLDGKIATKTGASKWITGEKAREHVHVLRGRYNGIMVGIGTILADDPMLNARIAGAHQPVRIVVDTHLQIPEDCTLVKTVNENRVIVAYCDTRKQAGTMANPVEQIEYRVLLEKKRQLERAGVEVVEMPFKDGHVDLQALMIYLGKNNIDSVLVEGGGIMHEACLKAGIVNHAYVYVAPKIFGGAEAKTPVEGDGVKLPAEAATFELKGMQTIGDDILLEYEIKSGMHGNVWNC